MTFESNEIIWGQVRQDNDGVEYQGVLRVEDTGAERVSLELRFVPPHPFTVNMPERHRIQAPSITEVYAKLVRFFDEYGIDLIC